MIRAAPQRRRHLASLAAFVGLSSIFAACSNPTDVVLPPLEALVASGDSQYGTANQTLTTPLQVFVRSIVTQLPRSEVTIAWSVEQGDASIVGSAATVTDSAGSARATVRMGSVAGPVTVRATVQEQNQARAEFHLFLVNRPTLQSISPTSAMPGTSVTLTGQNFSPDPDQDVVLFSGIRGRVTSASATRLVVTVPECLPERSVGVTVQLGAVASESRSLAVGPGGEVTALQVGDVLDAVDAQGYDCLTVPGDGTAAYVLLAQSSSALGAASHPFTLYGLTSAAPLLAAEGGAEAPRGSGTSASPGGRTTWGLAPSPRQRAPVLGGSREGPGDTQARFDERLRGMERELTRGMPFRSPGAGPAGVEGPAAAPPAVGERRTFHVFRNPGDFVDVTAVARLVGQRAALFVDEDAPSGGYTQADLQAFSDRFDDFIHPTVTGAFGSESDLDGNERVVILFSPTVNALTARGATGFVAGFFFGIDLLPETEGSNAGEIFYALVPDPDGVYSDPRPKDDILELAPAILAHEFQHMVHFNQRVLELGAEANEAVWLAEGLAQYAEELVARAYEDAGDAQSTVIFRDGTRDRSRRYLTAPESVSVVISAGQGTLAERGGSFLHVVYLADQFGDAIVGDLTASTRIGVANVEFQTGTLWPGLLSDWWTALRLDGPGAETGPTVYPTFDLQGFVGTPFPLAPQDLGPGGFTRSGSLPSSSVAYYQTAPSAGSTVTVRIGGDGGGVSAPQAGLRLRIVRVQ